MMVFLPCGYSMKQDREKGGRVTQTPTSESGGETPPLTQAKAEDILLHANISDPSFFQIFSTLFDTEEGVAAAEHILSTGAQGDTLWASTSLYASAGSDTAPLHQLLTSDTPTIRVLAGGGLVARGDVSGFDPLVEALTSSGWFYGAQPPLRLWHVATQLLVRATTISELGPPFDADEEQIKEAATRWQQWLEKNCHHLHFDATTGEWSIS